MKNPAIEIRKSTRHSKISGNFAESLVLYWLSKYGFECALVDHTGIDIIARSPNSEEMLGISVKGRTRLSGAGSESVGVDDGHLEKCRKACEHFKCEPYYALVVDADGKIDGYIVPEEVFREYISAKAGSRSWKMSPHWKQRYAEDTRVKEFHMTYDMSKWWTKEEDNKSLNSARNSQGRSRGVSPRVDHH